MTDKYTELLSDWVEEFGKHYDKHEPSIVELLEQQEWEQASLSDYLEQEAEEDREYYDGLNELMDSESPWAVINWPSHYNSDPSGIQPIQITQHMSFCLGNVVKYVMRAKYKGKEIEDLKKAQYYLNKEIERLEGEQSE